MLRFSLWVFLLFLPISVASTTQAQTADWGPGATATPSYSVIYTGRLFGYFRYPDEQSSSETGCPAVETSQMAAQVAQFRSALNQLRANAKSMPLLIAMGDNFAPELLARSMRNHIRDTPYFGQMVSKDLFTPNPTGTGWKSDLAITRANQKAVSLEQGVVPSDNVACFMRLMGFDAAVPGQEDFYFGPERLRQLARFLAEPGTGEYKPVQMIAANLAIVSTVHNPAPRLPTSAYPKPIQEALKGDPNVNVQLPGTVMPWLSEVAIKVTGAGISAVWDCVASAENPDEFKLPTQPGHECTAMQAVGDFYVFSKPQHPSENFVPAYETLDPGSNHALCVDVSARFTCKLFSVQYPFFQYRPDSSGTTPAPYLSRTKMPSLQCLIPISPAISVSSRTRGSIKIRATTHMLN